MPQSGHVVFSQMEEVLFGQPAAQAVAEQAKRRTTCVPDGQRHAARARPTKSTRCVALSAIAVSVCSTGCRRTRRAPR